ncbi:phage terminase large subunit [Paenibacillus sp. MSJ-34]|uniref:phage terminase large subunit n=1 Tax=Paenibacillus sp. MSJ-34 TaxID=2841529 RepID=UPI001C0F4515|nr:phage terminase large subunit [Paenibacillus sp. MSJ-34]MBU5441220.1 phage terminase large subunit [Paenibacillus sp. MSJ-34]
MSILKDFAKKTDNTAIQETLEVKRLMEVYLYRGDSPERVELRKQYRDGKPITGKNGLRRKLGAIDLEYFGKAYFPHYFNRETPEFHRVLDALWQKGVLKQIAPMNSDAAKKVNQQPGSKRAIAAPRGHAKSTNVTFKDVIHAIVYEYKHYPIILSDSSDQAEGFLESIREEFEENEAIREDFGDLKGKVWRNNVILTSTGIKMEAIGSGKKIRGRKHKNWRPDLLVLDDIENDENVRTAEQRKKLHNWFFKAVSKSGDTYTDIFYIGTILHYDSLLAGILKNPRYRSVKYKAVLSFAQRQDLWDEWESIYTDLELGDEEREQAALSFFETNREEMLEGTQVLWEAKLSYYDLMVEKVGDGDSSFNSEYQNEPINPEDCLFNEEWFDYYNPLDMDFTDGYSFFGWVDPSLGKKKKSDFSAIITIAKQNRTGYLYVIDADIERRHPDIIITDVLEKERWLRMSYGKGYSKFGCETNQFQWFLKEKLAEKSAEVGLYLPIEEMNQNSDKVMRIQTLQPDIKNRYIKFDARHKRLLEQLKQFPMGAYDDGPDALEACRTLAKSAGVIDNGLLSVFRGLRIWG